MNPLPWLNVKALVAVGIALGLFLAGYNVASWRLTAEATAEELERTKAAEKTRDEAIDAYNHLAGVLSASSDQHAADMRKSQDENARLRNRVDSGNLGLRIAGACPRLGNAQAPAGPGVDSGTWAELAGPARRAYFDLRDGVARASAQLAACQDELKLRNVPPVAE